MRILSGAIPIVLFFVGYWMDDPTNSRLAFGMFFGYLLGWGCAYAIYGARKPLAPQS